MNALAFGFGSPADLAIIFLLALVIFGPKKLPELGKQFGQAMRELRKVTDELTGITHSVQREVESAYKPVLTVPPVAIHTSSPTVEQAVTHGPLDQEPEALMKPVVAPVVHETSATADAEPKGH